MNGIISTINHFISTASSFFNYFHSQSFSDALTYLTGHFIALNSAEWGVLFFGIVVTYMPIRKMGSRFLQGIEQLPIMIQLQKRSFILLEFLSLLFIWCAGIGYLLLATINAIMQKSALVFIILFQYLWVGALVGIIAGYLLGRILQQLIAKRIEPKYSKRIKIKKDEGIEMQSDIRDVVNIIAGTHDYDPLNYFSTGKIFVGLDEKRQPIFIPTEIFIETHLQIMGCTGSGKSVAAINILAQALQQGLSTVMFDPKVGADEWAPHVLKAMCEKFNRNFIIIDLQRLAPQINLLQDITQSELNELLQAGMGIEDKGGDGDYYRLKDRKAAREAAHFAGKATSFAHLFYLMMKQRSSFMEAADSFSDKLEMLASIPAVQTKTGINVRQALEKGDCLYIVGAMRDPQVKMLQKMVLLRLMQIIERRDRLEGHRHVVMFIDELKYFLTRPVLDALSTVRDHQCNLLLGHQAPGDLLDVSKDISGPACQNAVITNTNIKLLYKLNEERDQRWASGLTGEKTVMRPSVRQATNMGVGEITNTDERQLMGVQESLYSHNYFAQLKRRVGVIVGLGLAKLCFTSPVKVEQKPLVFPVFEKERDYIGELHQQKDVSSVAAKASRKRPSVEAPASIIVNEKSDHVDAYDELHSMNDVVGSHHHDSLEDIK